MTTWFPEKAPEFFAYQALIVRAERNYEGKRWVSYDRQFRREALARKDLNWSVTDPRLYNKAFTGRARSIARCIYGLQDDHTAAYCPKNPMLGWFPDGSTWPTPLTLPATVGCATSSPPSCVAQQSVEICRKYEVRCKHPQCHYQHLCSNCQGPHPWSDCSRNHARAPGPVRRNRPTFQPCPYPPPGAGWRV